MSERKDTTHAGLERILKNDENIFGDKKEIYKGMFPHMRINDSMTLALTKTISVDLVWVTEGIAVSGKQKITKISEMDNAIIIDDSENPAKYSLELQCSDAIEAHEQREEIIKALAFKKRFEKNQLYGSEKFNLCNPRQSEYCLFEAQVGNILDLFVKWNEKKINDNDFSMSMQKILGFTNCTAKSMELSEEDE